MKRLDDKTRRMNLYLERAGGATDPGPVRPANEDSFRLPDIDVPHELGIIYIVADGVGGQTHGAEASQTAVQEMYDSFYQARRAGQDVPSSLQQAAEHANMAIYEHANAQGISRMGCTVVAAVLHDNQRTVLHAGDARAYLLRDGRLEQLTKDDTWVQRQVDEGIIGEDTAQRHKLRHVVTRVLGNQPTVEVTISETMLIQPGDVLLLCSDGLHDTLADDEIERLLDEYDPQTTAEMLVQTAIRADAADNITALVVAHEGSKSYRLAEIRPAGRPAQAGSRRRQQGIRLPWWVLLGLLVGMLLALVAGAWALWGLLRDTADAPVPTVEVAATVPAALEEERQPSGQAPVAPTAQLQPSPTAQPLSSDPAVVADPASPDVPALSPTPAVTTSETITATTSLACISSPGALTFVWQEDQLVGSNCNQFAREGFVLTDGDQVIILDDTPRTVLGPDPTFCQENEFLQVQSVADSEIKGWVLSSVIRPTTAEAGCPSP